MTEKPILLSLRQAIEDAKNRIAELRTERGVIDDEIATLEAEIALIAKPPAAPQKQKKKRKCPTCGNWLRQCTCHQPVVLDDVPTSLTTAYVKVTPPPLTVAEAACQE
jgi:hypothetical protein